MERHRMAYNRVILREDLLRDEGMRLRAYKDTVGLWSIGIGHLIGLAEGIDPAENVPRIHNLSPDEVDALFELDLRRAEAVLNTLLPSWGSLDDVRARAMMNLAFALGYKLQEFVKMLPAVARGDWTTAGMELGSSKWAGQVGSRAQRLRKAIETGEDT